MNELKAGVLVTPHNEGMCFHQSSAVIAVTEGETEFYLKSEADKVIAHHKYKRCLAMADFCSYKAWYYKYNGKEEIFYRWMKFRRVWAELAKKFK